MSSSNGRPERDSAIVEQIISQFEDALSRPGERPRIEDYVKLAAPDKQFYVLVELVHTELEFRIKAGEEVRVDEYLERFPQLAASEVAVRELRGREYDLRRRQQAQRRDEGHRFRILRPHAKGGLGEVFIAEDSELPRTVALKEIQPQFATRAAIRSRFVLEAEITGRLEHPCIVPVYSLGQYADGRPFYAMRLIRGETLQDAIERFHKADLLKRNAGERSLELRKLLSRFIDVCEAVEYAHSQDVIHRDLKPTNIMLGNYGETMVVDWGLAKVIGRDQPTEPEATEGLFQPSIIDCLDRTAVGSRIGTLYYMSPEQAVGQMDLIGRKTDVYGLGATLYHLVTGQPPFRGPDEKEILRQIREGELLAPSFLNKRVPPALSEICCTAMSVQQADRYRSPKALADDIEHWLADEPVSVWREPMSQRLARWARRHRTWALAGTAALVIISIVSVIAAFVVNHERTITLQSEANAKRSEVAELEAKKDALFVIKFFNQEFLAAARPEGQGGLGPSAKIRDAADAAERQIENSFRDRPLVKAAIRESLGLTYLYLDECELAIDQHRKSLEIREKRLGPNHRDTLSSQNNLASAYLGAGEFEKAILLFQQTLETMRLSLGPDDLDTLTCMNNLAGAYLKVDKSQDALVLQEQARNIMERVLGPKDPETLKIISNLAQVYLDLKDYNKALPLFQQAHEGRRAMFGADHPDTLSSLHGLACTLRDQGLIDKALPYLEFVWEKRKQKLGADHSATLISMNSLATACQKSGDFERALQLFGELHKTFEQQLGPNHRDTLKAMNNLAVAYHDAGQFEDSLLLHKKTWIMRRETLGNEHRDTLASANNLRATLTTINNRGVDCLVKGQNAEAIPLLKLALEWRESMADTDPRDLLSTKHNLACAYFIVGQLDNALPMFAKVLAETNATFGTDYDDWLNNTERLARSGLNAGRPAGTESILALCLRAREKIAPESWKTFHTMSLLGASLFVQKNNAEAEMYLVRGFEGMKRYESQIPEEFRPLLLEAVQRLVDLYNSWGNQDEADRWRMIQELK